MDQLAWCSKGLVFTELIRVVLVQRLQQLLVQQQVAPIQVQRQQAQLLQQVLRQLQVVN